MAARLVEDFPEARFLHAIREPVMSFDSWFDAGPSKSRPTTACFPIPIIWKPAVTVVAELLAQDRPHPGLDDRTRAVRFSDLRYRNPGDIAPDYRMGGDPVPPIAMRKHVQRHTIRRREPRGGLGRRATRAARTAIQKSAFDRSSAAVRPALREFRGLGFSLSGNLPIRLDPRSNPGNSSADPDENGNDRRPAGHAPADTAGVAAPRLWIRHSPTCRRLIACRLEVARLVSEEFRRRTSNRWGQMAWPDEVVPGHFQSLRPAEAEIPGHCNPCGQPASGRSPNGHLAPERLAPSPDRPMMAGCRPSFR